MVNSESSPILALLDYGEEPEYSMDTSRIWYISLLAFSRDIIQYPKVLRQLAGL